MIIKKATPEDADLIAKYFMLAMGDIVYRFIGVNSYSKALSFLEAMSKKKKNQYSYENCWVLEYEKSVVAVANVYKGSDLEALRNPVKEYIKDNFNIDFTPEDETQPGEYYIDCVAVNPDFQGTGLGTQLFKFLIEEYVIKNQHILGLLVEKDNPNAKRLYLKLGFEVVGQKVLTGKTLDHLQHSPYTKRTN